jgi:hypothetical protein
MIDNFLVHVVGDLGCEASGLLDDLGGVEAREVAEELVGARIARS